MHVLQLCGALMHVLQLCGALKTCFYCMRLDAV